jgi:hypothetical protein
MYHQIKKKIIITTKEKEKKNQLAKRTIVKIRKTKGRNQGRRF